MHPITYHDQLDRSLQQQIERTRQKKYLRYNSTKVYVGNRLSLYYVSIPLINISLS